MVAMTSQPWAFGEFCLGDQHGAGAVVEGAGVAGGHGAFTVKHRPESSEGFRRGATTNAFVGVEDHGVATSLRNVHGEGFPVKPAVGPSLGRTRC